MIGRLGSGRANRDDGGTAGVARRGAAPEDKAGVTPLDLAGFSGERGETAQQTEGTRYRVSNALTFERLAIK